MKDDPEPMVSSGTVDDRAERLTNTIRDQSSPNLRPRDSATLILIDCSGSVPKVLLGRRHERHRFLPGKFVFPGGRVEIKDRLMPTADLAFHVVFGVILFIGALTRSEVYHKTLVVFCSALFVFYILMLYARIQ